MLRFFTINGGMVVTIHGGMVGVNPTVGFSEDIIQRVARERQNAFV